MGDNTVKTCANQHGIVITNLSKKETLTFSLALLKGEISTGDNERGEDRFCGNYVTVHNVTKKTATNWPILRSKFKCLVELNSGENKIVLKFCTTFKRIVLTYKPRKTDYFVTPFYIICKDHDGTFQAPVNCDNSVDSACNRILLGSKLIQCLVAEKLFENGFGRKTFQIESDVHSQIPDCIRFYSNLAVEDARKMDQEALWIHFGREIMKSDFSSNKRKFLAFLSATWWEGTDGDGLVKAHAALGGGGLALFGTGCLHTWPERIEDVITCFLDPTPVDTRLIMDDSCFRGTYGGCFSTTLGSVCHELGHTFDLGHSKEGIMGRGFDNIDLVFLPHSHCIQDRQQCMQFTTVQLISRLKVECIVSSAGDVSSGYNSPLRQPENNNINSFTALHPSSASKVLGSPSHQSARNINKNNMNVNNNNLLLSPQLKCRTNDGRSQTSPNDDDKTHWSPSCATLLAYHKWFNSEHGNGDENKELRYNSVRGIVVSSAGLRVVELRGDESLVLHSWQFTGSRLKHQLVVPLQMSGRAQLIVIEDTNGNILKQDLKTRSHINR